MKPLTALLLLIAGAALGAGKPNPYLGQAKVFYQGLEYEKCLARLDQATKWASEPAEQVEIELYAGLCNFNIGNMDEAKRRFDLALGLDPKLQLPPYTSPRIGEIFEASRKRAEEKLARMNPVAKKEEPVVVAKKEEPPPKKSDAPVETKLTPEQPPKEDVTAGVSTEKSYVAPIALAGASALSLGAGAYFGLQAKNYEAQGATSHYGSDAFKYSQQAGSSALIANVAFGVAATAAIGAAVTYFVSN
ncbi:MAG: hypothetical protein ACJ790_08190 [Myxococcaceae bacterium]